MANEKDNRVLSRRGARIVNEEETCHVNGGVRTTTLCTFNAITRLPDGDVALGEC